MYDLVCNISFECVWSVLGTLNSKTKPTHNSILFDGAAVYLMSVACMHINVARNQTRIFNVFVCVVCAYVTM